jgi:predicted XRE-type DNA-binding protein
MNGLHDRHSKKSVQLTNGIETINFASYTEAAKHVGVFTNHIGDLVRGKLNSAKGWKLLKKEI